MPKLANMISKLSDKRIGPLWKGPCGEGDLGGISQSMLGEFLGCRERFRVKYVLGLQPPDKWVKTFGYGNMWHVCEETLATGEDAQKWMFQLNKHCLELAQQYPMQREEVGHWANVCLVQFPEYVKYWKQHPDVEARTPLLSEQVFNVPYNLPSGRTVRLRGKWDSVDLVKGTKSGATGGIWLQENKTKGEIDEQQLRRQLKFDLQTMLYLVTLGEFRAMSNQGIPYTNNEPIKGVRYNVIKRPLSGGVGTIRQHKPTKSNPKGETKTEFYERLRKDYIADNPKEWFMRWNVEVSQQDVQAFRSQFLDPILEQLCCWYDEVTGQYKDRCDQDIPAPPLNFRYPFGVYNQLNAAGFTDYDAYLETGSTAGLQQVEKLFKELQ